MYNRDSEVNRMADAPFRRIPPCATTRSARPARTGEGAMTLQGTVNKTGSRLLILMAGAVITWNMAQPARRLHDPGRWSGGFIPALVTVFKKTWAPYHDARSTPPSRGCCWAAISADVRAALRGHRDQRGGPHLRHAGRPAARLPLAAHPATENFKLGVFAATGGIALLYLVSMVHGLLRQHDPLHPRVGHRSASGSACSWW